MKGMIQIKAGTYDLLDATRMIIRASDDGAIITFNHKPTGVHSVAVIDEHGVVVRRQIDHRGGLLPTTLSFAPSSPSPEPSETISESRIELLQSAASSIGVEAESETDSFYAPLRQVWAEEPTVCDGRVH